MQNLTISQQFFLCAVNDKGKMPSTQTDHWVCFVFSAIMDMQLEDCIAIDEGKKATISTKGPLTSKLGHLQPLHDHIAEKQPLRITKLMEQYAMGLSAKPRTALFDAVGTSLAQQSMASAENSGFLSKSVGYVPTEGAVDQVIDRIRATLLSSNNQAADDDTIILTALLKHSGLLRKHFSKDERKELKASVTAFANTESGTLLKKSLNYIDSILAAVILATTTTTTTTG